VSGGRGKVKGIISKKGAIRAFYIAKLRAYLASFWPRFNGLNHTGMRAHFPRKADTISARERATLGQTPEFCGLLIRCPPQLREASACDRFCRVALLVSE
jgi:hypothetical protein